MHMKKSISKKISHFFFLYINIAFLFSACSFRSEDKLLSQLIENWDNIPSNHQNISNLNSFLDDFERYKESDEYYVNTMINQNYLNNVKNFEESLYRLSKADNQTDYYNYYSESSKLLLRLAKEDNTISKKTIISAIFIFLVLFIFLIQVSIFLFIFLAQSFFLCD